MGMRWSIYRLAFNSLTSLANGTSMISRNWGFTNASENAQAAAPAMDEHLSIKSYSTHLLSAVRKGHGGHKAAPLPLALKYPSAQTHSGTATTNWTMLVTIQYVSITLLAFELSCHQSDYFSNATLSAWHFSHIQSNGVREDIAQKTRLYLTSWFPLDHPPVTGRTRPLLNAVEATFRGPKHSGCAWVTRKMGSVSPLVPPTSFLTNGCTFQQRERVSRSALVKDVHLWHSLLETTFLTPLKIAVPRISCLWRAAHAPNARKTFGMNTCHPQQHWSEAFILFVSDRNVCPLFAHHFYPWIPNLPSLLP